VPDILLAISVYSPDSSFDDTFLSNYTSINLVDPSRDSRRFAVE